MLFAGIQVGDVVIEVLRPRSSKFFISLFCSIVTRTISRQNVQNACRWTASAWLVPVPTGSRTQSSAFQVRARAILQRYGVENSMLFLAQAA
jgi:hypothetical protein